ncbi:hypothetical protein [Novipirellula aureliae]|uniref:hypothetical protein n=1 Tax=Novipirellula aureliae TaxID=2527966 RepID=UPI0011B4B62F|nr:hypothetical protein [Novipirellula aureliae]
MKTEVWNFLDLMYDDDTWPNTDLATTVDSVWNDAASALDDLVSAHIDLTYAEDDIDLAREIADEAEMHPTVGSMLAAPEIMVELVEDGLLLMAKRDFESLLDYFDSACLSERESLAKIILMHGFEGHDSHAGRSLLAAVQPPPKGWISPTLKSYAVQAFGKLDPPNAGMIEFARRTASNRSNNQSLRSLAIEALMDMGPIAKSAIPTLQRIHNDDPEVGLKPFAWAALKSVRADSREHPCGGTVAEHMRSLYRAENDKR